MKPNTSGLFWIDQETAERVADERRAAMVELLDRLREANERIDSHELHNIIDAAAEDLRVRL